MKPGRIYLLACIPLLIINLYAVIYNLDWLVIISEGLIFTLILAGYFKKLNFRSINFSIFLALGIVAVLLEFFGQGKMTYFVMFFQMSSYILLSREALRHTRRQASNRLMLIFFFMMIGANCYLVFRHFQEIGGKMAGMLELGFYLLYYLNLLVLAVIGLIYYLNSYSRKSVFFISMVMAIVVTDILRDMVLFYLPDTSVILLHGILKFSAVALAFQFYSTKEKKLKLINLV